VSDPKIDAALLDARAYAQKHDLPESLARIDKIRHALEIGHVYDTVPALQDIPAAIHGVTNEHQAKIERLARESREQKAERAAAAARKRIEAERAAHQAEVQRRERLRHIALDRIKRGCE
jgi:hypothetical protein